MKRFRDPQDAIELQCPDCEEYVQADPRDRDEDTRFIDVPCDDCQAKEEDAALQGAD